MDVGAAITALTLGAAVTGYAYRDELLALDLVMLGKLERAVKYLKSYFRKPKHREHVGRHRLSATEKLYTYIDDKLIILREGVAA